MSVEEFIINRLETCGAVEKFDASSNVENDIFNVLKRKAFRKWKLQEDTKARMLKAIKLNVANNEPIKIVFEFGGYKLWSLPSAPVVDWAEFFMLCHFARYVAPISKIYDAGVELIFASDDYVVERMNNISKQATDDYCSSFNSLLEIIKPYLPENIRFSLVRLAELYKTEEELENELKHTFSDNMNKFTNWSEEKKIKMIGRAELNFCKNSHIATTDLSNISAEKYQQRLIEGAVYHDAFEDCSKRKNLVESDDKILIFTTPIPQAVAIGSTKSSVTKFWTGVGFLEKRENGKYKELILSPKQLENVINTNFDTVKINKFDGLLSELPILEGAKYHV